MFGYITVNKDELKIKDYRKYKSYYCGVCHSLRKLYGFKGQFTLTYDMTFLAVLLSSLYEDDTETVMRRCVPHPVIKHESISNKFSDYAASMNVMLTYYKLKDDWEDERSLKSNAMSGLLKRAYKKAAGMYPDKAELIEQYILKQHESEDKKEQSIDVISSHTGEMLAGLFDMKQDVWQYDLRRMGFFLGKFIYVMDAYDDIEKDIKKNNFNPLINMFAEPDFDSRCENILTMYAAESSKAFEALPILDNADILRNILYSGIWNRFDKIKNDRERQ